MPVSSLELDTLSHTDIENKSYRPKYHLPDISGDRLTLVELIELLDVKLHKPETEIKPVINADFGFTAYGLGPYITDAALLRLGVIYPLPGVSLPGMARQYPDADLRWVQEEPANQGAWSFVAMNIPRLIDRGISCVSRPAASTPAVGTHQRPGEEQESPIQST